MYFEEEKNSCYQKSSIEITII